MKVHVAHPPFLVLLKFYSHPRNHFEPKLTKSPGNSNPKGEAFGRYKFSPATLAVKRPGL